MKHFIIIFIISSIGYSYDIINVKIKTGTPTVHVISIGTNKFKSSELIYAVSDSKLLIEKIKESDSIVHKI